MTGMLKRGLPILLLLTGLILFFYFDLQTYFNLCLAQTTPY